MSSDSSRNHSEKQTQNGLSKGILLYIFFGSNLIAGNTVVSKGWVFQGHLVNWGKNTGLGFLSKFAGLFKNTAVELLSGFVGLFKAQML